MEGTIYVSPLSINIVINKYNLIISAIFPPQDRSHFAKAYWCAVELFLFIFHLFYISTPVWNEFSIDVPLMYLFFNVIMMFWYLMLEKALFYKEKKLDFTLNDLELLNSFGIISILKVLQNSPGNLMN